MKEIEKVIRVFEERKDFIQIYLTFFIDCFVYGTFKIHFKSTLKNLRLERNKNILHFFSPIQNIFFRMACLMRHLMKIQCPLTSLIQPWN